MKKPISTDTNPANIAQVLELLTATPHKLTSLSEAVAPDALHQPLGQGERSFIENVAHILNCEERTTESIYAALLVNEPLVLTIHPERQWGKLLRYEEFELSELLSYFAFRRKVLLRRLDRLTEAQWGRVIREEGKARKESVYWRARGMALHELEHITDLESHLKS